MDQNEFKNIMKYEFLRISADYNRLKSLKIDYNNTAMKLNKLQIEFLHQMYNLNVEEGENTLKKLQSAMTDLLMEQNDNAEMIILIDENKVSKKEREQGYIETANALKVQFATFESVLRLAKLFEKKI